VLAIRLGINGDGSIFFFGSIFKKIEPSPFSFCPLIYVFLLYNIIICGYNKKPLEFQRKEA
jgi:hypothetical protein